VESVLVTLLLWKPLVPRVAMEMERLVRSVERVCRATVLALLTDCWVCIRTIGWLC